MQDHYSTLQKLVAEYNKLNSQVILTEDRLATLYKKKALLVVHAFEITTKPSYRKIAAIFGISHQLVANMINKFSSRKAGDNK